MNEMIELWRGGVTPWDCDEMGHWNVRQYVARAHDATLALQAELGLGEPTADTQSTLIIRDLHVKFLAEARVSAPLAMVGGILAINSDNMDVYFELRHVTDSRVAATFRATVEHINTQTRVAFDWPSRAIEMAANLKSAVPDYAKPRGLSLDPVTYQASGERADALDLIPVRRGILQATDCDVHGVMRPSVFIGGVSDGFGSLATVLRSDPMTNPLEDGEGGVALEYRLHYYDYPKIGSRFEIRSGLKTVNRKTRTTAHWMLCPGTGQPIASLLSVSAAFDLKTRKVMSPSSATNERLQTFIVPGIDL